MFCGVYLCRVTQAMYHYATIFVSVVMLIVSVVAPIWDQRILQISMVDLHFITSIDQLLFKLKLYFSFFY
jgi:hypothetical protein